MSFAIDPMHMLLAVEAAAARSRYQDPSNSYVEGVTRRIHDRAVLHIVGLCGVLRSLVDRNDPVLV